MPWHPEMFVRGAMYQFEYEDANGTHTEIGRFKRLLYVDGVFCARFIQKPNGVSKSFDFDTYGIIKAMELPE